MKLTALFPYNTISLPSSKPTVYTVKPSVADSFTRRALQRSGTAAGQTTLTPLNPEQIKSYFQNVQTQIQQLEAEILATNPNFSGKTPEALQQAFIADYLFAFSSPATHEEYFLPEKAMEQDLRPMLNLGLKKGNYRVVADELETLKSEAVESNNTRELPNALVKVRSFFQSTPVATPPQITNKQHIPSPVAASEIPVTGANRITEASVKKTVQEVGRIPQSLQDMSNPYALKAHLTPYIQYLESLMPPVESIQLGDNILAVTDLLKLLSELLPKISRDDLDKLPIKTLKPTLPLAEKIYQTASSVARSIV